MKNTSMNRQSPVSIFRLMLLVFGVLGILLTSLFFIGCGGDEEEDPPEVLVSPPLNDLGTCAAGMTLKPGESCSYVAGEANVVFFFRQDGFACREGGPVIQEIFGIQVESNPKFCVTYNIERDDAFKSNFAASKNPDGSWTIKKVPR